MKLLILLSTLVLVCATRDHSTTGSEPREILSTEAPTCSSSSEEEEYCERPQNEEEIFKRLTQDAVPPSMPTKSTKEEDSTADSLSSAGGSHTDGEEPKSSTIHVHAKVSKDKVFPMDMSPHPELRRT